MRRILPYLLDVVLLGAPWLAYLGLSSSTGGNWIGGLGAAVAVMMYASAGTALLFVVNVVLFLGRGRTLGMATTGLVAVKGRKWLALLLAPLMLTIPLLMQFWILFGLRVTDVLSEDTADVLQVLALPVASALNLVFLLGSRRRTLTDLVSGLHVVRDPALLAQRGSHERGPNIVDVLVALGIGAPMVLTFGQVLGAVFGCLVGLLAFGALELALWRRTGATLGMRALAKRVPTELAPPGAE
jgi:hypothetical protein